MRRPGRSGLLDGETSASASESTGGERQSAVPALQFGSIQGE